MTSRAELAARFRNRVPAKWKCPPTTVEYHIVLVLAAALRFPKVRSALESLNPDVLPSKTYRIAAALTVTGVMPDTSTLSASELVHLNEILGEVQRCSLDLDETWGMSLLKSLANQRFQPLMVDMLRWAADEVDQGRLPTDRLRRLMAHSCDIAEGRAAFDPAGSWEHIP